MLANTKAFGGFAVDDLHRARQFKEETLGLNVSEGGADLTLHLTGGRDTLISSKPGPFTPAINAILSFAGDNIDAADEELSARGLRFERYNGTDQDERRSSRAADGPLIARSQDPAGNTLSVLVEE